jgi:hypothetical protein
VDDSRLIAQFQRLTTEVLIEKRLGHRRPELTDEFYQAWLEVGQRGLKQTPEYRNVMKRADRTHGIVLWSPQRRVPDAGRALDLVEQIDGDVVGNSGSCVCLGE